MHSTLFSMLMIKSQAVVCGLIKTAKEYIKSLLGLALVKEYGGIDFSILLIKFPLLFISS